MKRAILLSTAALGIAILPLGAAQAQDPMQGAYIGVHGGFNWSDVDIDNGSIGGPIDGFIGGVLAGINFPHAEGSNVMFGIEGDIGWGNINNNNNFPTVIAPLAAPALIDGCVALIDDCVIDIYPYSLEWNAHLRARALFGQGTVRPFIAGGLALANLEITEYQGTFIGGTVGAGIDAQFAPHLIGRVEALYDFYGDKEVEYGNEQYGSVSLSGFTARAALILKFGGP
jgi:outer membrane immunogenic protein